MILFTEIASASTFSIHIVEAELHVQYKIRLWNVSKYAYCTRLCRDVRQTLRYVDGILRPKSKYIMNMKLKVSFIVYQKPQIISFALLIFIQKLQEEV